jgi:Uma2 family endonuclease
MRVRIPTGLYTYPDVSVACGRPKFLDEQLDTLLNPIIIVEVLSESTEAYNRGKKSEHYRSIESLAHYVLVASDRAHIEVYTRQANQRWMLAEAGDLTAAVELLAFDCRLPLAEVYEKVVPFQKDTSDSQAPPQAV